VRFVVITEDATAGGSVGNGERPHGEPSPATCPSCGTPARPGVSFCPQCGTRLA
jgi:hypothetical protein